MINLISEILKEHLFTSRRRRAGLKLYKESNRGANRLSYREKTYICNIYAYNILYYIPNLYRKHFPLLLTSSWLHYPLFLWARAFWQSSHFHQSKQGKLHLDVPVKNMYNKVDILIVICIYGKSNGMQICIYMFVRM